MSVYKNILDKILLSFSTLHGYEECQYSFYLRRIEEITGKSNAYAQSGSFGHDIFCELFQKKMTKQEALDKVINEFEDSITEEMSEDSIQKKMTALYEYIEQLDLDGFFKKYKVLGVEKKFLWEIFDHKMIGFADLILKRKSDGKIILVDHKSAGHFMKKDGVTPLKNQEENFETYKKQMYLYADAMKKTMGCFPDIIVWNHFLDGGKKTVIQFDMDDYEKSLQWTKNIIEKIYEDEEFIAQQKYMLCNVLCDYRDICEYKDE